jgi:hypothetical protein
MAIESLADKSNTQPAPRPRHSYVGLIWLFAWLGITAAGGLFGLIAGSIPGLFLGPIIAGVFAVPIVLTFALLTWAFWLSRYSFATATLAGASTGIMSAATAWDPVFDLEYIPSMVLAGAIGATVSGLFTGWYCHHVGQWNERIHMKSDVIWRYSLSDLFLRFTVVTALIAVWTFLITQFVK